MLAKVPSLRLKRWNATRWLGRSSCLAALCRAYSYVLDHLRIEMNNPKNKSEVRKVASELYKNLTSYDNLYFIHLYRDVTALMARYSKLLQAKNIQIPDVGRRIATLRHRLVEFYPRDSELPMNLINEGVADSLIRELLNLEEDMSRKSTLYMLAYTYSYSGFGSRVTTTSRVRRSDS